MVVNIMKLLMILMISLMTLSIILTGCNSNQTQDNLTGSAVSGITSKRIINIDKLEIYHFHGTNQCYSCITVGDYAEETVNTYFKEELDKGIIVFDHINGQLPEHNDLVMKYGATGSSLWIGTYNNDSFTAEQNIQVWYKLRNKETYMTYLKGVIEQKLQGK
jgi:hypothetical protein